MLYRATGIQKRHMVLESKLAQEVLVGAGRGRRRRRSLATGIAFRRLAGDHEGPTTEDRMERYAQEAPTLAAQAANAALEQAGLAPRDVTHLVTVSCTGFGAPGVDIQLFKRLGLKNTVQRVHVGFMGCHGAINGMRAALGLVRPSRKRTCSSPASSSAACTSTTAGIRRSRRQRALRRRRRGNGRIVRSRQLDHTVRIASTASCLVPDTEYAMTWDIGNHGFEMTLSSRVPTLIAKHVRPFLDEWLDRHGLSVPAIKSWAVHPGGPRFLSSVEKPLGIDESQTNGLARSARRARQHVVAHRALHHRSPPPAAGAAPLRRPGLRTGVDGRSGFDCLTNNTCVSACCRLSAPLPSSRPACLVSSMRPHKPSPSTRRLVDRNRHLVTGLTEAIRGARRWQAGNVVGIFGGAGCRWHWRCLLDTSGSMTTELPLVVDATRELVARLRPDDRMRIGAFGDRTFFSPGFTQQP